ncbi:ATP-binding protein [Candidatus Micrarchaeota archaeon]|nr:ATP-binding protein [Candidatus Micrarchaeota archaeon]
MEIGTVISTEEGPSTEKFSFVLSSPSVRRGQFVQLTGEEGLLIGVIKDIFRANRYFERAESISEYEKNKGSFLDNFPVDEWEYVVAECSVLGAFDSGTMKRSSFPPSPGEKVHEIELEKLKDFLGFKENGLNLGKLLQHELEAKIELSRLCQKHLALVGMSGCGKSYASAVLIEELLDRKKEMGRVGIVVFDSHGDYIGFADKHSPYADRTEVIDGRRIRIATHKMSAQMFHELMPEISATQGRELAKIIEGMKEGVKKGEKAYDLDELVKEVEKAELKENIKGPLVSWLGHLKSLNLFSTTDYPSAKELVKPGKLSIFDLSDLTSLQKKQMILAYFAKKLFNLRRKESIPPFLMLVEEAHNFAREKAPKGGAISKGIIETIAREGRKFGASLCLVSQRPVQLSTTALSQCNTFLIMRVTNPFDLKHIGESCEAIDSPSLDQITSLKVGEGILIGEAINYPTFLKIRRRKSLKAGKGDPLEEMAKKFEAMNEGKELSDGDIDAFI